MSELSERAASGSFPAVANAEAEATKLNQGALQFMLGAQKMMYEEWVFLGDEMLERTRTEMHLFTEFVTKMAGAHSVRTSRRCARNAASISSTSSAAIPNGCSSMASG